jgi:hypothetical protein
LFDVTDGNREIYTFLRKMEKYNKEVEHDNILTISINLPNNPARSNKVRAFSVNINCNHHTGYYRRFLRRKLILKKGG